MAFDKDKFWAHVREPIANLLYAGKMKKELELLLNNKVDLITLHQYLQPSFLTNLNKDVVYF